MAASTDQTTSTQNEVDDLYTIEASVVTGFEESARGEARERFGTDVMAARGKITWKVPLHKVKNVLEMGSVDNCRVVIHSVPCFHFTDQYDSLACLQKMVRDIDWEAGLKAWQHIYNFPYPLVPHSENPPSADDLVDVVIITAQPPPRDKSAKKNKKKGGGWGKRKQSKKEGEGLYKNKVNDGVAADVSRPECEFLDAEGIKKTSGSEKCLELPFNEKGDGGDTLKSDELEDNGLNENDSSMPEVGDDVMSSLIIRTDGVSLPKSPGNFQTGEVIAEHTLNNKNLRQDEIIEIETSCDVPKTGGNSVKEIPAGSPESQAEEPGTDLKLQADTCKEEAAKILHGKASLQKELHLVVSPQKELNYVASPQKELNVDVNLSNMKLTDSEFASSVIKRLTSPYQLTSGVEVSGTDSPKILCVTPPPTPIRSVDNPFFNLQDKFQAELLPFIDNVMKFADRGSNPQENLPANMGSKVDPPLSNATSRPQPKNVFVHINSASSNNFGVPLLSTLAESANIKLNSYSNGGDLLDHANINRQQVFEANLHQEEINKQKSTVPESPVLVKKERDPTKPTFRVTCNRVGDHHQFDSASAAASLGSAIITYLKWQVDLKNFDIEVMLNIDNEEVIVALALTKMSLHYRNLVAFGPTSLRATICCNMLRLCRITNGDFVCDLMCGSGAIPIEGAVNWVNCYHIGGDNHDKAIEKTSINVTAIQDKMKMRNGRTLKLDVVQWDVQYLPLRNKTVDVFVSDLPFGYRVGKKSENLALYSSLLSEMARAARTGARACLLTQDKSNLIKALQTISRYWQRRLILNINIGGLSAFVFLLTRTTAAVADTLSDWPRDNHQTGGSSGKDINPVTNDETATPPICDA